jgi:hypothetical protein
VHTHAPPEAVTITVLHCHPGVQSLVLAQGCVQTLAVWPCAPPWSATQIPLKQSEWLLQGYPNAPTPAVTQMPSTHSRAELHPIPPQHGWSGTPQGALSPCPVAASLGRPASSA